MLGLIFAIVILAFDFAISIWNAYASGYDIGIIRRKGSGGSFAKIGAYSGLALAFVGMSYVFIIVLGFLAFVLGYVGPGTVSYLLSFDFLVFGLLIIGLGIVITIQSILVAVQRRSIGSILVAIFNSGVEIFDIVNYIEGFKEAVGILKSDRRDTNSAIIIAIVAVLIAFFVTFATYKHGLRKALSR